MDYYIIIMDKIDFGFKVINDTKYIMYWKDYEKNNFNINLF